MPRGRKRGVVHRVASPNLPLAGTKRVVADVGRYAVYPRLVVWGRQPEPVRKHGERLLMVRADLLRMPPVWLAQFVERVMSDERLGYEWRGVDDPGRFQPFVEGPVDLPGEHAPDHHLCARCGGGRLEGRRFQRWKGSRKKSGRFQKKCVDCVWWEKQLRIKNYE